MHFPDLWEELKEMDKNTYRTFKPDYTVEQLEYRFDMEQEWLARGESITSRIFFNTLKQQLGK